ncbi:ectonucleotide pyrophosphatase/phosphodiesterase [soil metagenome]
MYILRDICEVKLALSFFLVALLTVVDVKAQSENRVSETVARGADHVILISVDGLRPEFYQESHRPTPMLQKMAREGVQADAVRGVFPSVTYPSHTTLVTGALPAAHGIYYNSPFEPEGQTGRWYWEYEYITTETLWEAASKNNMTTASIRWPVTVGAPIDYNLPEVWDLEGGDSVSATRRHTTPEGFMEEIEEMATGKLSGNMFSGSSMMREDRFAAAASYIIKEYKPNLFTIHIVTTDSHQHSYGREHEKVDLAFATADRAISRIVEAAEQAGILDRTAFVIAGDHGFTDISARVAPNVWLVEAGLMEAREDRGDWRATFHATGGTAFLYLQDPDDTEAIAKVRDILDAQPHGVKKLFRIVERDELDAIGADPNVPFALNAIPTVGLRSSHSGDAVIPATGGTHGHFPDFHNMHTGFVAWGSGVRKSVHASKIGMEDIAPFVAELLDLPFEAPQGIVLPGFLE